LLGNLFGFFKDSLQSYLMINQWSLILIDLLSAISAEFLTRLMEGQAIEQVHVRVSNGECVYGFL